jgi:O-antigen/teichoic acid export membrane protein
MADEAADQDPVTAPPPPIPLRTAVVQGGMRLLARQGAGLVLSIASVLVMTRAIGPTNYGVYSAAFGVMFFAQATGEMSLDLYLVRHPGELSRAVCDQVFTLLVISAVGTTAVLLILTPEVARLIPLPDIEPIAFALFASIPLVHLQQVHLSRLERDLDYTSVGAVELIAQLAFVAIALPLAFVYRDAWAPVAGWWLQQIVLLGGFWMRDPYRPRMTWHWELAAEALKYGAVTNSSNFVYSLRNLVVPVLGSRILGPGGVGYVSLALRIGQQLGFLQAVIQRISIAVLGKIATDRERFRRVLTQASELQVLCVGVPIAGFSLFSATLIPLIFGQAWRPVAELIPRLAPAYIALAMFAPLIAALSLARRPWALVATQATSAALLWLGALVLLPRFGVNGYGYAELFATGSWLVADWLLGRQQMRPDYSVLIIWGFALSAAALAPITSWWLVCAAPLAFASPMSRREIKTLIAFARAART